MIISATPATPEFDALRQLAQIAVNIVDYIDADDICTPFVWNPINPGDPHHQDNFRNIITPGRPPSLFGNHVVFGVEKPAPYADRGLCRSRQ